MPQQYEQQAQTDPILLLTPGFAEPLTYDHQWVFLHQDTPCSDPQAEALPEEEAAGDSQEETLEEEVAGDSQEEAADSPAGEDQHKAILKEDHPETDL